PEERLGTGPLLTVPVRRWATRRLAPNGYLFTPCLTTCSALALIDQAAGVVSLAHFNGEEKPGDIAAMFGEMVQLGARNARVVAYLVGGQANSTAAGVYNCMEGLDCSGTCVALEVDRPAADCCAFGDGFVGVMIPEPPPAPAPRGRRFRFPRVRRFFKKIF